MTHLKFYYINILLLPILLFGCLDASESDYERQVREADEIIETYLTDNNIDAEKQASGVYIEVVRENEDGKQVLEDHVLGILYEMTHLEGEYLVESHTDTSNLLRFSNSYNAAYNAIYPVGLNYEAGKMRQGEKFRFYIPSYQAFGSYSHGELFGTYSHFIVEVDLIEVKTEEEIYEEELDSIQAYIDENELETESYPNGLHYILLEEGDGDKPSANSQITLHFTRKYLDGTVIETTTDGDPRQIQMNTGRLVTGLENGLPLMKEGGKAIFIMPSKLAFGKSAQVIPQPVREVFVEEEFILETKPYSPVIYEIDLLEVN